MLSSCKLQISIQLPYTCDHPQKLHHHVPGPYFPATVGLINSMTLLGENIIAPPEFKAVLIVDELDERNISMDNDARVMTSCQRPTTSNLKFDENST